MKRKIIRLGKTTLVASLPTKWTREFNLNRGDYLDVEERNGELILSAKKISKETEKNLDFTKVSNTMLALLILQATYNAGFDTISISHQPEIEEYRTRKKIKTSKFLQGLVREQYTGMEIIEQTEKKTIFKE